MLLIKKLKSIFKRSPISIIHNFYKSLSKPVKIGFFTTIIAGFFIHLYRFTNMIPNHDGISAGINFIKDYSFQGRWFQHQSISIFSDTLTSTWINGALSILFIALSVAMIISLVKVKKSLSALVISVAIVSFPSVAAVFGYLYLADGFFMSVFLAVLAVYVSRRFDRFGFLFSSILLCFSMGVYQAFISIAITLYLILAFMGIVKKEADVKQIIIRGIKDIVSIVLGVILYMLCLQLSLAMSGTALSNYKGMNEKICFESCKDILSNMLCSFKNFFKMFLVNNLQVGYRSYTIYIYWIVLGLTALFALILALKNKIYKKTLQVIVFLILALLFPVAFVSANILSTDGINFIGYMSISLIFVLFVSLFEEAMDELSGVRIKNVFTWLVIVTSLIICFENYIVTNNAYYTLHHIYEKSYAQAIMLSMRLEDIKTHPDYEDGMKIGIYGDFEDSVQECVKLTGYSYNNKLIIQGPPRIDRMLCDHIGANYSFETIAMLKKVIKNNKEQFESMSIYPAEGSIDIIDGLIVVRLSEDSRY